MTKAIGTDAGNTAVLSQDLDRAAFGKNRTFRRIAVTILLVTGSGSPVVAQEGDRTTPESLVAALHTAFGDYHVRAVHAKGIMLKGHFTPSPEGRSLSKANLFTAASLPITVRFSDFTGIPTIADTDPNANPRGLAIKFQLPDGSESDIVSHSFNGFPVPNADQFRELMLAIGASGPDAKKPTKLDTFLTNHPIAATFLTTQKPAPVSYATLSYFGVNAFKFTSSDGKESFVRYRFLPISGEQFLNPADFKGKGANYLIEELPARVAKSPVQFEWYAQDSGQGDVIDNPSIAWPESRTLVKLGILTLERMAPDQPALDKATIFLPNNVPAGIETADPMLDIRSAAYPVSFGNRQ